MIRPEVAQKLNRWREALAGFGAAALGSYWMVATGGALKIIGTVLTVGGALLIVAGIQRARFRQGAGGPGIVQIDEGQVTYFGPFEGGALAIDTITALHLDAGERWIVSHDGGEDLVIPVDAAGSDALFDVFAGLPELDTETMLAALKRKSPGTTVLWQKRTPRLH